MSFLAPLFLAGVAAAAIPIVLHLLRREPEARVKFAFVRLLRRAPVERTDRRRLRELLLLALRISALVLLAIAFARPFLTSTPIGESAGVTVVVLDTSLSLSAPGRFERAQELARAALDRAPAGELTAVVTFAEQAQVAAAPSDDRGFARSAISGAAPGFGATRYRTGIGLAADLLAGRRGTLVVVTDLQASGWSAGDRAEVPASARLELVDVGPLPDNLAVTAVRVQNDRVVATVRNAGPVSSSARVRLTVDDRPAGEGAAAVAANQSTDIALPAARGSAASVSVEDAGGIPGDNIRYVVLDGSSRPGVLIVTADGDLSREAFYAGRALAAAGGAGPLYRISGVSGAQLSTWDRRGLAEHAAVVLLSTRGLERAGRALLAEFARQGGGVLIASGPQVDGEVVAESFSGLFSMTEPRANDARPRGLAPSDARHPLFRAFGASAAALGLVTFDQIAALQGPGCQTLARFTTGEAALIECPAGAGRALVLASDLDSQWNNFPRHATFVPFLHEAVRYLASGRSGSAEYMIGEAPAGVPSKPGFATVPEGNGRAARRIAINVDPAEADPARLTADEFQAAVTRAPVPVETAWRTERREQEGQQRLWQYAFGAMLALLLIESVVAAKTA